MTPMPSWRSMWSLSPRILQSIPVPWNGFHTGHGLSSAAVRRTTRFGGLAAARRAHHELERDPDLGTRLAVAAQGAEQHLRRHLAELAVVAAQRRDRRLHEVAVLRV